MAEGEFAEAQIYLEKAANIIGQWVGDHDIYAMLADTAARQRDFNGLEKYAPLADQTSQQYNHRLYRGISKRAIGVLATLKNDLERAEQHLTEASEIFLELGTNWQRARTEESLGFLKARQGEIYQAKTCYNHAIQIFEDLQAIPDMRRVEGLISNLVEPSN